MDDHAGGLVDGHHVVVFVQDLQRQRFRLGFERRQRLRFHFDGLVALQQIGGLHRRAIGAHAPAANPTLQARAAVKRHMVPEE